MFWPGFTGSLWEYWGILNGTGAIWPVPPVRLPTAFLFFSAGRAPVLTIDPVFFFPALEDELKEGLSCW